MTPREVVVLVDWQNVLGGWRTKTGSRGKTAIDADEVVLDLVEGIRVALHKLPSEELVGHAWLYGSGLETGNPFGMHIRQSLRTAIISERKLKIALNTIESPLHLLGEPLQISLCPKDVQRNCRHNGCTQTVVEQKLADTMIVADAIHYSTFPTHDVVIFSDDEDMVPGLLLAAHLRRISGGDPLQEILWYRPNRTIAGVIDAYRRHFLIGGQPI